MEFWNCPSKRRGLPQYSLILLRFYVCVVHNPNPPPSLPVSLPVTPVSKKQRRMQMEAISKSTSPTSPSCSSLHSMNPWFEVITEIKDPVELNDLFHD